jgi:hypothetical protein
LAFGVAEQCSRVREGGGALSEPFGKAQDKLREFAPPPEWANRARNPKGHARANMVLGPFAVTKGPRLPGRNPQRSKQNLKKINHHSFPLSLIHTFLLVASESL